MPGLRYRQFSVLRDRAARVPERRVGVIRAPHASAGAS
jgi:hypothetical protein